MREEWGSPSSKQCTAFGVTLMSGNSDWLHPLVEVMWTVNEHLSMWWWMLQHIWRIPCFEIKVVSVVIVGGVGSWLALFGGWRRWCNGRRLSGYNKQQQQASAHGCGGCQSSLTSTTFGGSGPLHRLFWFFLNLSLATYTLQGYYGKWWCFRDFNNAFVLHQLVVKQSENVRDMKDHCHILGLLVFLKPPSNQVRRFCVHSNTCLTRKMAHSSHYNSLLMNLGTWLLEGSVLMESLEWSNRRKNPKPCRPFQHFILGMH